MVRHTLKFGLMLLLIWIVLPTGPADIFIIPAIINVIGQKGYVLLCVGLIVYLYLAIPGKTLKHKLSTIKEEIAYSIRKIKHKVI